MKGNIESGLLRAFGAAYLVIFGYMALAVWRNSGNVLLFGALALVFCAAVWGAYRLAAPRIDAMSPRAFRALSAAAVLAFAAFDLYLAWRMRVRILYDLEIVASAVPDVLDDFCLTESADYFITCTNNLGIVLLLSAVYGVAGLLGGSVDPRVNLAPGIFAAVALCAAAVWLVSLCAKEITGRNSGAALAFVLCAGFAPFYLWMPVFYTSTMSLVFGPWALYAFLRARRAAGRRRFAWLALSGAAAALGFIVKGNWMVMGAAVVIALALDAREVLRERLVRIAAFAAALALVVGGWNFFLHAAGPLDLSKLDEEGIPVTMWLVMGAEGSGAWNGDLKAETRALPDWDARAEMLRERLIEDYRAFTPKSYFKFWNTKMLRTWSDGRFGTNDLLVFPVTENWTNTLVFERYLPFRLIAAYSQAYLLALYAAGIFYAARLLRRPRAGGEFVAHLSMFGLMFFLTFYESWASYVFNFTPLWVLALACGVCTAGRRKGECDA